MDLGWMGTNANVLQTLGTDTKTLLLSFIVCLLPGIVLVEKERAHMSQLLGPRLRALGLRR